MHAYRAGMVFTTYDRDVLLPHDPANLLLAWQACAECGLELTSAGEPLDRPRDLELARRVVEHRALTEASDEDELHVDLTLVMKGYEFEEIWRERTFFMLEGVEVPVARLRHIVASKAAVGRLKDQLFLATHVEALRQLLGPERGKA
jgi:hypothetical protein